MASFDFFNYSDAKIFGKALALEISKEIPPALIDNQRKILSVNKITRILERIYQSALDFQKEHHLGFIKRSILANAFKWELKANGFPADFIDMATEGLIVKLSNLNHAFKK